MFPQAAAGKSGGPVLLIPEGVEHFLAQSQFLDGIETHVDDGLHDIEDFDAGGVVGGIGQVKDPGGQGRIDFDDLLEVLGRGLRVGDELNQARHDALNGGDVGLVQGLENFFDSGTMFGGAVHCWPLKGFRRREGPGGAMITVAASLEKVRIRDLPLMRKGLECPRGGTMNRSYVAIFGKICLIARHDKLGGAKRCSRMATAPSGNTAGDPVSGRGSGRRVRASVRLD